MQLTSIYPITAFVLGLLLSTTASCSQEREAELEWKPISASEMLIDVTLPSGTKVKSIRYRKEKLANKWLLQLKNTSGTKVTSAEGEVECLSQQDFKDLFVELISFIKNNNNENLDKVQLDFRITNGLWKDTMSFLRNGAIPADYKLSPKDLYLAKQISSHLEGSSELKVLCEEIEKIQKVCKDNFVSMNPITFEEDYIGKEWNQVDKLPNAGIPVDKLWFGLSVQ